MFKIVLDAGHGRNTIGNRCLKSIDPNQTREWVLNARICDKIQERLQAYKGVEILRVDDISGQKDIPLSKRVAKANEFNADIYLSVHHNAGIKGGGGGGLIVYTFSKPDKQLEDWQEIFYDEIVKRTGLRGNRYTPLAKSDFYVLTHTKMQALLIENGFMDSTTDTPIILTEEFANKSADGYVAALVKIGGLEKVNIESPTTSTPKTNEEIANEVRAGKWGNGADRKNRLTAAGYDYAAIQAIINGKPASAPTPTKKTNEEIAKEVIQGKWGVGSERKKKLTEAGYNYSEIQAIVNERLS